MLGSGRVHRVRETVTWSEIEGATSSTYTPTSADEGKLLRVVVEYADGVGSGRSAVSAGTQKVGKAGAISLDSRPPVVGVELTAALTDDDGSVADEAWRWESSPSEGEPVWSSITDADSASYTPVAGDAGLLAEGAGDLHG